MRRVLQRGKKGEDRENVDRAVQRRDSDEALEAAAGRAQRSAVDALAQQSSLPRGWASARPGSRRSLGRRSQSGSKHDSDSVSPSRSVHSKASNADFRDIYDRDEEQNSELNPDVEHQLDARDEDFEDYDLPRPGAKDSGGRAAAGSVSSPGRRLSAGFRRLVGSRSAAPSADAKGAAGKKPTLQERLRRTSKRISFRKTSSADPEAEAAASRRESLKDARREAKREAKERARRDKEQEKRRQKDMRSNPWYPAGVDFRYLSPKTKWLPFLGRKPAADELDFGDEARLLGVAQR